MDTTKLVPVTLPTKSITMGENVRKPDTKTPEFKELVASIKQMGILVPVHVTVTNGKVQLVAGFRRFAAAQQLELERVPVTLAQADDLRAITLVENIQRRNLTPLEECEAFAQMEKDGNTAAVIAVRIGKSVPYVKQRLCLVNLPADAKKALAAGLITLRSANVVARVTDNKLRKLIWENLEGNLQPVDGQARDLVGDTLNTMTRPLVTTAFDIRDQSLNADRPPCVECPYNSSNDKDLFGDLGKESLCTDPPCWDGKADTAWSFEAAEHEKRGGVVMSKEEIEKEMPHGWLRFNSKYVDLNTAARAGGKRTLGDVLGKKVGLPILARVGTGKVMRLVTKDAIRSSAPKATAAAVMPAPTGLSSSEADRRRRHKARQEASDKAITELLDKVVGEPATDVIWQTLVPVLARAVVSRAGYDVYKAVGRARGWTKKGDQPSANTLTRRLKDMATPDQFALMLECLVRDNATSSWSDEYGTTLRDACKAMGVRIVTPRQPSKKAKGGKKK